MLLYMLVERILKHPAKQRETESFKKTTARLCSLNIYLNNTPNVGLQSMPGSMNLKESIVALLEEIHSFRGGPAFQLVAFERVLENLDCFSDSEIEGIIVKSLNSVSAMIDKQCFLCQMASYGSDFYLASTSPQKEQKFAYLLNRLMFHGATYLRDSQLDSEDRNTFDAIALCRRAFAALFQDIYKIPWNSTLLRETS